MPRAFLFVLCIALAAPALASAQSVTAFKSGEQKTGTTKQCYYRFGSNTYTETVEGYELCPLSIEVRTAPKPPAMPALPSGGTVTAFKTGEQKTGTTKQCYYRFGGSSYTKTVEAYELCPLSIEVRQ